MSDPIAEHLYSLGHWKDRKIVDRLSKQIRQQIGRELLDKTGNAVSIPESNKWADGWNDCRDVISEVCQLEEE